jgi:hypothetical protein
MSSDSRKRSSPQPEDVEMGGFKRQRISYPSVSLPTRDLEGKSGLERAISLTLSHVGFEGAAPEAMTGFTAVVEECMHQLLLVKGLHQMLTIQTSCPLWKSSSGPRR